MVGSPGASLRLWYRGPFGSSGQIRLVHQKKDDETYRLAVRDSRGGDVRGTFGLFVAVCLAYIERGDETCRLCLFGPLRNVLRGSGLDRCHWSFTKKDDERYWLELASFAGH